MMMTMYEDGCWMIDDVWWMIGDYEWLKRRWKMHDGWPMGDNDDDGGGDG